MAFPLSHRLARLERLGSADPRASGRLEKVDDGGEASGDEKSVRKLGPLVCKQNESLECWWPVPG